MAKKTLGHVELEWTCPSCGKRNPGGAHKCRTCGTAMPEDRRFEVAAGRELDTSGETAARVNQGPDIHCPYCGARNAGGAATCRQCGGDLSEGARREAGGVLGAFDGAPPPDVTCPHCGATNPGTAATCTQCGGALESPNSTPPVKDTPEANRRQRLSLPVLLLIGLLACAGVWGLVRGLGRTSGATGTVTAVEWTYAITVEQLGPVEYEDWRDEIPSGARLGECTSKVRQTVDEPVPGATEECGTPYVEDTGTGHGRVVQDCRYHVPDDWCRYTVQEWVEAGQEEVSGTDLSPYWPAVVTSASRREASRTETYRVVFEAEGGHPVYRPDSLEEFQRFTPGSRWEVEVNRLGAVVSAEPAP